jgi:hypothetical protein
VAGFARCPVADGPLKSNPRSPFHGTSEFLGLKELEPLDVGRGVGFDGSRVLEVSAHEAEALAAREDVHRSPPAEDRQGQGAGAVFGVRDAECGLVLEVAVLRVRDAHGPTTRRLVGSHEDGVTVLEDDEVPVGVGQGHVRIVHGARYLVGEAGVAQLGQEDLEVVEDLHRLARPAVHEHVLRGFLYGDEVGAFRLDLLGDLARPDVEVRRVDLGPGLADRAGEGSGLPGSGQRREGKERREGQQEEEGSGTALRGAGIPVFVRMRVPFRPGKRTVRTWTRGARESSGFFRDVL